MSTHAAPDTWTPGPPDDRYKADLADCPPDQPIRTEELLAIVVGAHPRAELNHRPLATRMARLVRSWQAATLEPDEQRLLPTVCTDLWFLNDRELMRQPCIVIGEPGVNAAAAHYAARLPRVYVVENHCAVQFDPQFLDGSACLWGIGHRGTLDAFEMFANRYLGPFLRAMH
jgi:hypothetical protein